MKNFIITFLLILSAFQAYSLEVDKQREQEIISRILSRPNIMERDFSPLSDILTEQSVHFIIRKISDGDPSVYLPHALSILTLLNQKYPDLLINYKMDEYSIKLMDEIERKGVLDEGEFDSVVNALMLLGMMKTDLALDCLQKRYALEYWINKENTYEKEGRVLFDKKEYINVMREIVLHAVFQNEIPNYYKYVEMFMPRKDDPIYRNLSLTLNNYIFGQKKMRIAKENNQKKKKLYDELYKMRIKLEVYYIDHREYPEIMTDLPEDPYKPGVKIKYAKTSEGYRLWSEWGVSSSGEKEKDDFVTEYP